MSDYLRSYFDSGDGYNYKIKLSRYSLLYYEIPKNASSSIKSWLFSLRDEVNSTKPFPMAHEKWRIMFPDMQAGLNDINDPNLTKFIFLRNPFARLLSGFNNTGWKFQFEGVTFDDFVLSLRERIASPTTDLLNNHFKPVNYFVPYHEKSPWIDFIGKVENLGADIRRLAEKVGAPTPGSIPHLNSSEVVSYRKYYSRESREIVEEIYRVELEMGSYVF